jgi:hypothetical protein
VSAPHIATPVDIDVVKLGDVLFFRAMRSDRGLNKIIAGTDRCGRGARPLAKVKIFTTLLELRNAAFNKSVASNGPRGGSRRYSSTFINTQFLRLADTIEIDAPQIGDTVGKKIVVKMDKPTERTLYMELTSDNLEYLRGAFTEHVTRGCGDADADESDVGRMDAPLPRGVSRVMSGSNSGKIRAIYKDADGKTKSKFFKLNGTCASDAIEHAQCFVDSGTVVGEVASDDTDSAEGEAHVDDASQ